jgi:PAS domain S-box-containing protein
MEKNIQENSPGPGRGENLPTVVIVEDDLALNRLMRITLEREGFKTHQTMTGAEALVAARVKQNAIILLDYNLPDMNAGQIITTLREEKIETPIIIATGNGDEKIAVEMMKVGARDYIVKEPDFLDKLPKILRRTFNALAKEKELVLAQKALRESESKYRGLYQGMLDAYVMEDMAGKIIEFNQAYINMVGYSREEIQELTYIDLTPEKWHDAEKHIVEEQIVKRGYSDIYEKEYRRRDGTVFPIELRTVLIKDEAGNPTGMWGIIRDISERKRAEAKQKQLEEQLRQSQKLEAIGQLSSGVAHDFNNILGGIMGHAELLKRSLNPGSPLLHHADIMISLCEKAADLTHQLLSFARKAPVDLQKTDVNLIIKQVAGLIERTIDRRIEIVVDVKGEPAFISGDRSQLENALLNIAINARDAMPEGGRLSIRSGPVDVKKTSFTDIHFDVKEGPFIKISIADTGTGMNKEIQDRIFEPFFTTKEVGKGTGLGLASVYGCVKQHNGYITVESQLGKGTRFDLYFPAVSEIMPEASKNPEAGPMPGTATLLVVDDEPIYHEIIRNIFGGLGYSVHCCGSGAQALDYYQENSATIDVVILDINMPAMNGFQCYRRLKEINRDIRVIVASGYGDNADRDALQKEGARAFIQKPYKAADLSAKIAEIMGKK